MSKPSDGFATTTTVPRVLYQSRRGFYFPALLVSTLNPCGGLSPLVARVGVGQMQVLPWLSEPTFWGNLGAEDAWGISLPYYQFTRASDGDRGHWSLVICHMDLISPPPTNRDKLARMWLMWLQASLGKAYGLIDYGEQIN